MKKLLIIGGISVTAFTIWYFVKKQKESKQPSKDTTVPSVQTQEPSVENPVIETTNSNSEEDTFAKLSEILKSDPAYSKKPFPSDFFPAIQLQLNDYKAGQAGRYNAADIYKGSGKVGAFMAVSDAWQTALGYSDDTHEKLWDAFNDYRKKSL